MTRGPVRVLVAESQARDPCPTLPDIDIDIEIDIDANEAIRDFFSRQRR